MGLVSRLTWSLIYDFCFEYCVEGSGGHHEVADVFNKVAYLNPDVPEEGIMIVYTYTLARNSSVAKPDWSEWVPTSL